MQIELEVHSYDITWLDFYDRLGLVRSYPGDLLPIPSANDEIDRQRRGYL